MADELHVELVRSKRGPSYIARFHGTVNRIPVEGELTHPIHYHIGETATHKTIDQSLRIHRTDGSRRDVPFGARRKVEQAVLEKFLEMEAKGPVENPEDPALIQAFDLWRAGFRNQARKKLRAIDKSRLSRSDQHDYDLLTLRADRFFSKVANPWEHEGGGCMVGSWAEGEELPCDDTFVNEDTGERREFKSSVDGHLQGWHRSDEEITDEDLEDFEARVDVTRLKAKLLR